MLLRPLLLRNHRLDDMHFQLQCAGRTRRQFTSRRAKMPFEPLLLSSGILRVGSSPGVWEEC